MLSESLVIQQAVRRGVKLAVDNLWYRWDAAITELSGKATMDKVTCGHLTAGLSSPW